MFGSILGGLISGAASLFGGSQANKANSAQAAAQMQFQADQSEQSQAFGREMVGRNELFQREMTNQAMAYNTGAVDRQEQFQRETMNSAMAFDREMANTSYQRGMADMRAAGLNPILAYKQGGATAPTIGAPSGASSSAPSPTGSTAVRPAMGGAQARMQDIVAPALSTAIQGSRVLTELDQLSANVHRTEADTELVREQTGQVKANTALQVAQAISEGVRPDLIRAQLRTEEGRPGLVASQAAQASSSATSTQQEIERFRNWGPRTTPGDYGAAGEAVARRGWGAVPDNTPERLRSLGGRILEGATNLPRGPSDNAASAWAERQRQSLYRLWQHLR